MMAYSRNRSEQMTDPQQVSTVYTHSMSFSTCDLMETADKFSEPGVTSYSQILFDIARNQILVGAKDSLFRLGVSRLEKLEKAVWQAPSDKVQLCQDKGQTEPDCHNFIKVLLSNGKKLFTCGTNAYSPQCSWRELEDISRVTEWVRGVGKCPYSPVCNVTSLLSLDTGHLFLGSPVDFSGADAAIVRDLGPKSKDSYLRTNQYNSKWLNDPQFVGSFETEFHVYFLFRETAVEYINCGKRVYSRIGRVCKNDTGGQLMLRDNWTTFVKARLNCSLPGEYPFYYDDIQAATYLPDQGVLYATFTTPRNSIPGSAICAFNMSSIEASFNGWFKHQNSVGSAWEREGKSRPRQCNQADLLDSSRFQLMDQAVQPSTLKPLYHSQLETLTHIAVAVTVTKHHNPTNPKSVHVLYVATLDGFIKKISILPRTHETCVLEIWKPYQDDEVQKMYFLKYAVGSVYIGLESGVLRVAGHHCARYTGRDACVAARDPHCGWDDHIERCTPPPEHGPQASHWIQEPLACPTFHHPVDGGWSAWSNWSPCQHATGVGGAESSDQCQCSVRSCDNPAPARGGKPCLGLTVRVCNCTVHGAWSIWSGWSACSQTCGMAVKTRRRMCSAPPPAHGGRVCVGLDRQEMYCHSNPPCPGKLREGGWGGWGPWGECSAKCGGGYRVRTRQCNNPPPLGNAVCPGCHIDYQVCNIVECPEGRRLSPWSSWFGLGNGTEKRIRYACRAPSSDPNLIRVNLYRSEERLCSADGCSALGGDDDVWSEWSSWSPCSADCGSGTQTRQRTCDAKPDLCLGQSSIARPCNTHHCKGEWGCWSDWSSCSSSCGPGLRQRTRLCLSGGGTHLDASMCPGLSLGEQECHNPSCSGDPGWSEWSEWSSCDDALYDQHSDADFVDVNQQRNDQQIVGGQQRSRTCVSHNLCHGQGIQTRACLDISNEATAFQQESIGGVAAAGVAGYCLLAFALGAGLGVAGWILVSRRRPHRVPSSPHYISSKQNPYVTVPLREPPPPKRTPSFSRHGGAPPKLFKTDEPGTATIKRNSHVNGHARSELEQDKFF